MEINSVKSSPNFGARIIVQKTGFKNLGADLIDSFKLGSSTTGSGVVATTESTILPSDAVKGFPFSNKIGKITDIMGDIIHKIFHRNIKTTTLEGVDTKALAQKSTCATTGSGMISTGIESYDLAVASALDQSVHYPNSVFSPKFPEFSANHFPQSVNNHLASMEDFAYDRLWDPRRGCGNECASTSAPTYVGLGSFSQGMGFDILTKGKKVFINAEETQRKLPS